MKNCLILGSGRSGTSVVAGCLRNAGYYMGDNLIQNAETNPTGFFESRDINKINEDLLGLRCLYGSPPFLWRFFGKRLRDDQLWLACVPVGERMVCPEPIGGRIQAEVKNVPYCFKDPRFSYTLPAWRPFLKDTVFVCVFREPGRTVNSILSSCEKAWYLGDVHMTPAWAFKVWTLMYRHILQIHRHDGDWLFIHYEQVLDRSALRKLEQRLDARVDYDFPQQSLKRSSDRAGISSEANAIYEKLCRLAEYES